MTDVAEILPVLTRGRRVSISSVIHLTLGVRAVFFLRYRLVE